MGNELQVGRVERNGIASSSVIARARLAIAAVEARKQEGLRNAHDRRIRDSGHIH
jgi:hypothetical protein